VRKSTVTFEGKSSQGSGWVIQLGSPDPDSESEGYEIDQEFPVELITNDHVIEKCHESPRKVRATANGETYEAILYSYDEGTVSVGTPYGLEGTVAVGNIMNKPQLRRPLETT